MTATEDPMLTPIQPRPDTDSEGFWNATATGRLELCWCEHCQWFRHPPIEACPRCANPMSFKEVSGRGTIYSYIVVHRAVAPGYGPGNVIALVELPEQAGLRIGAQLLDVADPEIGMPVRAHIEPLPGGDYKVPVWRPA